MRLIYNPSCEITHLPAFEPYLDRKVIDVHRDVSRVLDLNFVCRRDTLSARVTSYDSEIVDSDATFEVVETS
jgi:hypothetical protein